jgi:CRP-like cAMP-binding protein
MANAQAASLTARLQLPQNNSLEMKVVARQGSQYAELSQLFAGIPRGDCAIIVSAAHPTKFPRRQTIFFAGDAIKDIVLLTEGSVKITQLGENGSAVILRLEGPGEIVGSLGSAQRGRHNSTAEALLPCRALVWNAPTFEALSQRFPLLQRNTMRIMAKRLQVLEGRFREISTERVAPRLARELVRLLPQVGRRVDGALEINLSREELAQMTATTLFTVSRLLSSWEKQGILSLRREVVVVRSPLGLLGISELK